MKKLDIDLECSSSIDLAKCGIYRYVESPDFAVTLFGYAVDDGEITVIDLANGERIPEDILAALTDDSVIKWAHNVSFERVCLSRFLGMPTGTYLSPKAWRCSMVWSAYLSLPQSLKEVGAVLNMSKQKLTEGKDLIRFFCTGQHTPEDDPERWAQFKAYNKRDLETEMEVQRRLSRFPVPDTVWKEFILSEEINDRGVLVDMPFVQNAILLESLSRAENMDRLRSITGLDNPNSNAQMKAWLAEQGLTVEKLDKKTLASLLKTAPDHLREALFLYRKLSKTSVKKYAAMENAVCSDGRVRGMFRFYGAAHTGRFSSKLIQLQNLAQNHLPDLENAKNCVRTGTYDDVKTAYPDIPDTLSQLVRTALIPRTGRRFIVADYSAIEARIIAWLAGEEWKSEAFANGEDIYCTTASRMFKVPVIKNGINGDLRQRGKVAELACIAEGEHVLTDAGLVPIEKVTTKMKLWDGKEWVSHDGVVFKGERDVITYEGLTATPDHLVFIEGKTQPVRFEIAAASGAHLIQTGNGRRTIRLGNDYQPGKKVESTPKPLLCFDVLQWLWKNSVAESAKPDIRKVKGMSKLFQTETDSEVAERKINSSKRQMRKSKRSRLQKLRSARNKIRVFQRNRSGIVFNQNIWHAGSIIGNRQNRQQRKLCSRQSTLCNENREQRQQTSDCIEQVRATILALLRKRRSQKTVVGSDQRQNNCRCRKGSRREAKELANHQRTARLYDIRNAGRHHRFTVSGKLVHNCGYGGSVGALTNMGALEIGLEESELKPLVDAWRRANPNIVHLWWDVDRCVRETIRRKTRTQLRNLTFEYKSQMLFITLPSGRQLVYAKPHIGPNRFDGTSVIYEGVSSVKKWDQIESYGPKFVENIVQGIARDILCYAMKTLRDCDIVAHVHDELIIEADKSLSLETVCKQMSYTPPWADGLILRADGYECTFYQKS